jgi:hypothetical protein
MEEMRCAKFWLKNLKGRGRHAEDIGVDAKKILEVVGG